MHTIYIIGVMVIIPAICVSGEFFKKPKQDIFYLICKWFTFWAIGVRLFTAGLMQAFNPSYTANLLQITTDNYLMIQELGFSNIAMGILGILSLFRQNFRKPAALCSAIFLAGAAALHIGRTSIIEFGEFMSLVSDLFVVVIAIMVFIAEKRETKLKRP